MVHYKVTYFNVRALGEPIRMMLHYMGKEFEDNRLEFDEWLKIKPSTPFGKLPILEIDGKKLHQSLSICRYLAKEAGLAGSNDCEDLQIDMVVDTFQDFRKDVSLFHHEADPVVKEAKKQLLMEKTLPYYFEKFDAIVKENGGFLANGKLSWADFFLGGFSDSLNSLLGEDVFKNYPNLVEWRKNFFDIPKVKDWVSKRPESRL